MLPMISTPNSAWHLHLMLTMTSAPDSARGIWHPSCPLLFTMISHTVLRFFIRTFFIRTFFIRTFFIRTFIMFTFTTVHVAFASDCTSSHRMRAHILAFVADVSSSDCIAMSALACWALVVTPLHPPGIWHPPGIGQPPDSSSGHHILVTRHHRPGRRRQTASHATAAPSSSTPLAIFAHAFVRNIPMLLTIPHAQQPDAECSDVAMALPCVGCCDAVSTVTSVSSDRKSVV